MYNNFIHMHIFDVYFYGLHIAPTWYGLSYAIGFIICYFFIKKYFIFRDIRHIDSLLSFIFFGIILWGRIWYVILYNPIFFLEHPMQILRIWEWWMSFHGGFIGTILAVYLFCKKYQYRFWSLIDTLAIIVPIAIWLGRIGNWINWELPWYAPYYGLYPMNIGWINHFPSPLFEMLLEGIILFLIMVIYYLFFNKNKPGYISGIFLIGYSSARIIAEQYRLPDEHIGYLFWTDFMTLGILYTVPMIIYWIYLLITKRK